MRRTAAANSSSGGGRMGSDAAQQQLLLLCRRLRPSASASAAAASAASRRAARMAVPRDMEEFSRTKDKGAFAHSILDLEKRMLGALAASTAVLRSVSRSTVMAAPAAGYHIGTHGKSWGVDERERWLAERVVHRSYEEEVVTKLDALRERSEYEVLRYGALSYDASRYALYAVKSRDWDVRKPCVLVTGGVHGYETSGVQGALLFLQAVHVYAACCMLHVYVYVHVHVQCTCMCSARDVHVQCMCTACTVGVLSMRVCSSLQTAGAAYGAEFNLLVVPCVSPWGYETVQRWNAQAPTLPLFLCVCVCVCASPSLSPSPSPNPGPNPESRQWTRTARSTRRARSWPVARSIPRRRPRSRARCWRCWPASGSSSGAKTRH